MEVNGKFTKEYLQDSIANAEHNVLSLMHLYLCLCCI